MERRTTISRKTRPWVGLGCIWAMAFLPTIAAAQIDEIIVTAQKRAESLQDVPIAISALTADQIKDRQISSMDDIAAQVPGLEFGEVAGTSQVSIRGVGLGMVSGVGENSVAIHIDGVYLPRPGASNMVQDDLGGLEVLRGPQGTLYGRNATAGVLNLISTKPPEQLTIEGALSYGDYDHRKADLSIGAGLLDSKIRIHGSVRYNETKDDWFINTEFPEQGHGAFKNMRGRINIDINPVEPVLVELRALIARDQFDGPLYEAYRPGNAEAAQPGSYDPRPYRTKVNDRGDSEKDLDVYSAKISYDISDKWVISALTGYTHYHYTLVHGEADGTSNDLITIERDNEDRTFTEELVLSFIGERVQWTSGAYYLNETYDTFANNFIDADGVAGVGLSLLFGPNNPLARLVTDILLAPLTDTGVNIRPDAREETESFGLFTDLAVGLWEGVTVYAGVRYSDDQKTQTLTDQLFALGNPALGLTECENFRTDLDYQDVSGRAGGQYRWGDSGMVYIQASKGFKAGGFAIAKCGVTFEPEILNAVEIGTKTDWWDGRIRANASAFYYDYENLQVEEVVIPDAFVNNAQAEVKGIELEFLVAPDDAWELGFNASWTDAVYTKFVNDDVTESIPATLGLGRQQNLAGNRLNRSPEWLLNGFIQYTLDTNDWGSVSLRGDATYKSDYYLREFNLDSDMVEAHTIYNAFLTYSAPWEGLSARAFVKNISNEAIIGGFIGLLGYKAASFGAPRTWGVSLTYRFAAE